MPQLKIRYHDNNTATIELRDYVGWDITQNNIADALKRVGTRKNITFEIKSGGGSVIEGNDIINTISRWKNEDSERHITTIGTGIVASMAVDIFELSDVRKLYDNSYLMIHKPTGGAYGTADDVQSTAELLRYMEESTITVLSARTGLDSDEVRTMMYATTWMNAKKAKKLNFIDEIINSPTTPQQYFTEDNLPKESKIPKGATQWIAPPTNKEQNTMTDEEIKALVAQTVSKTVKAMEDAKQATIEAEKIKLEAEKVATMQSELETLKAELATEKEKNIVNTAGIQAVAPSQNTGNMTIEEQWVAKMKENNSDFIKTQDKYPKLYKQYAESLGMEIGE